MIGEQYGQQYLEKFDNLDLVQKEDRRLAVYVLKEFFGTLMARVGREYVDLEEDLKRGRLPSQWGRIVGRLESLQNIDIPDEYRNRISELKTIRDDTAHNYDYDPPADRLEKIRGLAPRWRDDLLTYGEEYYRVRKELEPRGTIIELARSNIEYILSNSEVESPNAYLNEFQEEAEQIQSELYALEDKEEGITNDLIYVLNDAKNLRNRFEFIRKVGETSDILRVINDEFGQGTFKRSELEKVIDTEKYSYSIHTSLDKLEDEGYLKKYTQGPKYLIIHGRRDEIINGENLDPMVDEEINRLISEIDSSKIRNILAETFNVPPSKVEEEIQSGDTTEKMRNLSEAIDAIENSPNVNKGKYGKIHFIRNPSRYQLTEKGREIPISDGEE